MSAQPRDEPLRSLLVVRLGAMGDVIHTMYAVSALRAAVPETRIGWVVEERWAELLCANHEPATGARTAARPLVDFLHVVDTKKWRQAPFAGETRSNVSSAFREIRARHYDVSADFQGAIKSAVVARFAGAQSVLGMKHPRESPARLFYSRQIETRGAHVIEQYHSLAEAIIGRTLPWAMPEFPNAEGAEASLNAKLGDAKKSIAILNPGAGWAAKQWPAERYGEVARALVQHGLMPVINFGPGEEYLAQTAVAASAKSATAVSCSIAELIALTRRASLFVGGDTGPMHLAAALNVPVVAIFGPTDPARNGPYGTKSVVLRNPASNTSLSHTSNPDPGLLQITSVEVIRAARQLLEEPHA